MPFGDDRSIFDAFLYFLKLYLPLVFEHNVERAGRVLSVEALLKHLKSFSVGVFGLLVGKGGRDKFFEFIDKIVHSLPFLLPHEISEQV